ncbi:murein hydrolase activator EnvC family protein [Roseobacter denitrificans]|uniref:M23 peptidase domain protein, putative n=1 Tax=Roseobacter denitrificans (strain ATCC 33942 / OCh 114) TaxID=375451 RepID=Q16D85_ROSDO|nr:peptidase M23 [Roseobacter denitrificans]ABG30058.1 M23 peptidase domain protein, putative [Roseobacter denitrificans OCh 114]SFF69133.1 Septal ring factor EnvC, activator of murein hydrolases AmiA and AmiB [Roseobacter denitrificans OCh 114]
MPHFIKLLALLTALLLPALAVAQTAPAERARLAVQMLDEASEKLETAQSARDRVRALSETVIAFEEGLGALRSGLRQATAREAQLSAQLIAQEREIASLLAVLQRVGGASSPVILLHPGGPTGAARAGMLVAEVTPALSAKAAEVRRDLEEMQALAALQTDASARLEAALQQVQDARAALNQAMAERTELPKRFVSDPVNEAILIDTAETLDDFAAGLDRVILEEIAIVPPDLVGEKGALDLPVRGHLLRASGAADAAGIRRPGIILATRPAALVTSPVPATLRYVGPLLDFGQVVILEPQADVLFVFAGLETVYGAAGDVIEADAPLGLMGGVDDKIAAELSTDGDQTGTGRSETLYIEVRVNNTPEDPSDWFRTYKDG